MQAERRVRKSSGPAVRGQLEVTELELHREHVAKNKVPKHRS